MDSQLILSDRSRAGDRVSSAEYGTAFAQEGTLKVNIGYIEKKRKPEDLNNFHSFLTIVVVHP